MVSNLFTIATMIGGLTMIAMLILRLIPVTDRFQAWSHSLTGKAALIRNIIAVLLISCVICFMANLFISGK